MLWVFLAFWLFDKQGVWVYVVNPLLMIFSLFVFSAVFSITIGKREQARLFTLATKDGLTGLYVIRHFQTLLNDAVMEAHKKQQPLSIILLDLDFFKKINDEYGHVAGDVALRYVAENIRLMTQAEEGSRETNAVGRYGGEEFIVMFKKCHLIDAAFNYAEKIRRQFEQNSFAYEGVRISLTVSLGVATLRPEETVPDVMVLRADEALYRAKTEGRNRVCIEKDADEDIPKQE
ncbi:MAG: GGDEF domain-containing protein, partial [Candidatus Omnitrophica bacterium]|nr:GGDEF domain-containing protein [Candidatus Omnitrophota bacterium]